MSSGPVCQPLTDERWRMGALERFRTLCPSPGHLRGLQPVASLGSQSDETPHFIPKFSARQVGVLPSLARSVGANVGRPAAGISIIGRSASSRRYLATARSTRADAAGLTGPAIDARVGVDTGGVARRACCTPVPSAWRGEPMSHLIVSVVNGSVSMAVHGSG